MFFRVVGQYTALFQDALRDDSRTNDPLLVPNRQGIPERTARSSNNTFDLEWLFSFLPTPGTVIYVGYGGTLREPEAFRFGSLGREHDSYFIKLSYLFRN
jgi:hypothetical protein